MKNRIIIFLHALAIVLLQFIPNTIPVAYASSAGAIYQHESFIYDFSLLWGTGSLWFPLVTVFSFISLCFAFVLLIWDRQWSKTGILSTSIPSLLLMMIPIFGMIRNSNLFSAVLVMIFVLLISEIVITAVSMKQR